MVNNLVIFELTSDVVLDNDSMVIYIAMLCCLRVVFDDGIGVIAATHEFFHLPCSEHVY